MRMQVGMVGGLLVIPGLAAVLLTSGCQQSGASRASGEIHVNVTANGFEPAEVRVPAGRPVTLVMTRKTDQTCATEVEFASLHQRYSLPLDQPVTIRLPATQKGALRYECGMHMLSGRIVVQ